MNLGDALEIGKVRRKKDYYELPSKSPRGA
jgi:hypothetical protein